MRYSNSAAILIIALLIIVSPLPGVAQDCPSWAIASAKDNTLYLYFPTAADATFPEYGILGASTSPVNEFDIADLDATAGTTAALRQRIHEMVVDDYCEFSVDVQQATTMPAPTEAHWQIVGIGSDSELVTIGGVDYIAFGLAQAVDLDDDDTQDWARVWADSFGEAYGGAGEALNGGGSTLERWATAIGETVAHEAGHNYGVAHENADPRAGSSEDAVSNHILATGNDLSGEIRASRNRHFSDTSYQILGHNIGLNWETFHNWDFTNPNTENAHALVVTILSEASSLTIANYYSGSMSPWTSPTITNTLTTQAFQGTTYDVYELELRTAQSWSGTTPGVVPPDGSFHVGVVFSEPDAVIVYDTDLEASDGSPLELAPRLVGYDVGALDLASGDFSVTFFNTDPTSGPLVVENLTISYLPRLPDIESMIDGAELRDLRGIPVTPLRVPRIPGDETRPRPKESFGIPGQPVKIDGVSVVHTAPVQVANKVTARIAGLAARRHVDLTYDDADCEVGVITGNADIEGGELRYCPDGTALSLFPATSVYITATVIDPDGNKSKLFYQVVGFVPDLNDNGTDDLVDIRNGTSNDANANGVPDEVEPGRADWSLHAGIVSAEADLALIADTGFTLNIDYTRTINRHLAWDLRFGFSRFDGKTGLPDIDLWTLSGNLKYTINPWSTWRVFVNGGPGLYLFDPGDLELGGNLGLGLARNLSSNVVGELTYNYHWPLTASRNLFYSQAQVGVIVKF